MNRSLTNVLFGGIAAPQQAKKIEGEVTQTTVDDTVEALTNAENVIIVCVFVNCKGTANFSRLSDMVWPSRKRNTR